MRGDQCATLAPLVALAWRFRPVARRTALVAAALLAPSWASAADPTKQECVSANDSAQDLRRAGRLREARERLALCLSASCPGPVREDCAQRLDEVDRAMPSVVFEAKDAARNDLSAVRVTIDGQPLTEKLEGAAVAVDPGPHRFVFEAEGLPKTEKALVLHEGEKGRRERIVLAAAQPAPPRATQPATGGGSPPVLAIAAGGVGVVGLAVGIGVGLAGTSKHSTLNGECNTANGTCPPSAANDLDSFHTLRAVSTVGYVVGALGIVGGGVLFFAMPASKESPASTGLYVGPASCGLAGTF